MRSVEGKAQDKLVARLRGQGCLVQKWTDLIGTGLADLMVAIPAPLPGIPRALWVEVKATDEVPHKKTSPWWAKCKPRPDQVAWLTAWSAVHPAGMFFDTPLGWTFVPVDRLDEFFATPYPDTRLEKAPPSYLRLVKCLDSH